MKAEQRTFTEESGWGLRSGNLDSTTATLVLVFGERHVLASGNGFDQLRQLYPAASIVFSSSSGEILDTEVVDDQLHATAMSFSHTQISSAVMDISESNDSHSVGSALAKKINHPELSHVFVISDGQSVNGAELARGFNENLPESVKVTGGMAGDGDRFELTLVGLDGPPTSGRVVAIGFCGDQIEIGCGCAGGWESFGPERVVTRSAQNVLFELDGQSALALYKKYLGDQAAELPGSALRFPLSVFEPDAPEAVVRTILSIDEKNGSMTFAGDISEGARVSLMRASYEDLIGGAEAAAEQTAVEDPDVAICVSCVGRRIVLGQRTEEETESVRSVLGEKPIITGFYSYGELAPSGKLMPCQLHNQTMTITTLREVA